MTEITVVTGNKKKALEIGAIIGRPVDSVALDIAEIQSLSVEEVAFDKAQKAYEQIGRPVIVDDTGMSIPALGGMPGALVVWFLDNIGPAGIVKLMAGETDRSATVSTAIGYADEGGVRVFTGTVRGSIPQEERGDNGFGYDTIFVPEGQERTYAEMTSEEKNRVSMRSIALLQLAEFLADKGG